MPLVKNSNLLRISNRTAVHAVSRSVAEIGGKAGRLAARAKKIPAIAHFEPHVSA
jgi:hypothetical protein